MSRRLVKRVLSSIESRVDFIDSFWTESKPPGPGAGLNEAIDRRVKGENRPLVIYGFENFDRIRTRSGGIALDTLGIFYLKLPAELAEIQSVLKLAREIPRPEKPISEDEHIRRFAIQEISKLKHMCDNVSLALGVQVNQTKKALKQFPHGTAKGVPDFIGVASQLQKLSKKYREIEPKASLISLAERDRVSPLMEESILLMKDILEGSLSPQDALDLAEICIRNIRAVSEILEGAKELA